MAERRMFAKTIIDSDAFLEMPQSSQLLYFHLSMRADDEGFVNKPKTVMRMLGSKDDDMNVLILRKFILPFDSGIVVIKHWRIHNYLQKDRIVETKYLKEKEQLELDENKAYRLIKDQCIQNTSEPYTQVSIGKSSIELDKISIDKDIVKQDIAQVVDYLNSKANKHFRLTDATTKLIKTRLKEGFLIDDFYRVIDNQCSKWLSDPKMNDYLRPQTLFGTKFESYLNTNKTTKGKSAIERLMEL